MPCSDYNENWGRTTYRDNPEQQLKIDKLTSLLCYACFLLESLNVKMGFELQSWNNKHKLEDKARAKEVKRRQDEQNHKEYLKSVKARLIKQLDADEKEALGL